MIRSASRRLCPSCRSSLQPGSNRHAVLRSSSTWAERLQQLLVGSDDGSKSTKDSEGGGSKSKPPPRRSRPKVIDVDPTPHSHSSNSSSKNRVDSSADDGNRPPRFLEDWSQEFQPETPADSRNRKVQSTARVVRIAAERVLDPSAVALLGMSASAVLGIGALEGAVLCSQVPFLESSDAGIFVGRYALEQLLPSCVWSTQDANLVATAMGYDPAALLQSFDATDPTDATTLLRVRFLETSRSMAAGFMLLAQLVRIGTIGAAAPGVYEDRVKTGREPPILGGGPGLIIRLCGRESDVTSTSLRRMGRRLFPVFEEPINRIAPMVAQHSEGGRVPVFWSIRPDRYGAAYSWNNFPASGECLVRTSTGRKLLILEADATNVDDPLALGEQALDLTIDNASQGFRRIQDLFNSGSREGSATVPPFRTLRVYLGNSLEISKSGGGHAYTLRHRVRYSKEVDVLIDSRAPVLGEILRWCDRVTATSGKKKDGRRIILFQTSSRQYFLSVQLLMAKYGYAIHDPLDWLDELRGGEKDDAVPGASVFGDGVDFQMEGIIGDAAAPGDDYASMLQVLMDERSYAAKLKSEDGEDATKKAQWDTLRQITRLSRLPRLVYYGKTAETVNAVQALVNAGEVDAANCCALLDKQEGTHFLKNVLSEKPNLVRRDKREWRRKDDVERGSDSSSTSAAEDISTSHPTSGLHIICSSTIYDDLFRQVRQWSRMGYSAKDIQREFDGRYQDMLRQSLEVSDTVTEVTKDEEEEKKDNAGESMPEVAEAEPQAEGAQAPTPEHATESEKDAKDTPHV